MNEVSGFMWLAFLYMAILATGVMVVSLIFVFLSKTISFIKGAWNSANNETINYE